MVFANRRTNKWRTSSTPIKVEKVSRQLKEVSNWPLRLHLLQCMKCNHQNPSANLLTTTLQLVEEHTHITQLRNKRKKLTAWLRHLSNPVYTIKPVANRYRLYNRFDNRLYCVNKQPTASRLSNGFDNRLNVCIHDTTCCQTGCIV